MADPFQKINPGDKYAPNAVLINHTIDIVKEWLRGQKTQQKQGTSASGVLIHNNSGDDLAIGGVVGIGEMLFDPQTNISDIGFESIAPSASADFAILQDGIPDDEHGNAIIHGPTMAKLLLSDTAHTYADAGSADYDKLHSQSSAGPARIFWAQAPANTQLNGAINSSVTTINVDTVSEWPEVPFVILIGTEKMNVTAVDGTEWTVTRAYASTSAATHADNAAVAFVSGVVWALVVIGGSGIQTINGDDTPAQVIAHGIAGIVPNITTTAAAFSESVYYSTGMVATFEGGTYRYINTTTNAGSSPTVQPTWWEEITGDGLTIINLPDASANDASPTRGMVNSTTQRFKGQKTFEDITSVHGLKVGESGGDPDATFYGMIDTAASYDGTAAATAKVTTTAPSLSIQGPEGDIGEDDPSPPAGVYILAGGNTGSARLVLLDSLPLAWDSAHNYVLNERARTGTTEDPSFWRCTTDAGNLNHEPPNTDYWEEIDLEPAYMVEVPGATGGLYVGQWTTDPFGNLFAGGILVTIGSTALPVTKGGTGSDLSATGPGLTYQPSVGAALAVATDTRIVSQKLELKIGTDRWLSFGMGSL